LRRPDLGADAIGILGAGERRRTDEVGEEHGRKLPLLTRERTRALLNRFYDAIAAEIASAGGTVEKFVGDAVMAAFGAPAAQEDHAGRALHAVLSMQRRLEDLFGDTPALRIGVNTGYVVVGQPREGSSFASRIAEPGGVSRIAGVRRTYRLAKSFANTSVCSRATRPTAMGVTLRPARENSVGGPERPRRRRDVESRFEVHRP
jgi:class 3 adenylate cyclase